MDSKAIVDVTVSPKSSRSKVVIDGANNIKIYLTDPPVEGKANAGLVSLLSKTLRVPKSSIIILHGETGKKKRLSIEGLTVDEVMKTLRENQ